MKIGSLLNELNRIKVILSNSVPTVHLVALVSSAFYLNFVVTYQTKDL